MGKIEWDAAHTHLYDKVAGVYFSVDFAECTGLCMVYMMI